MKRRTLFGGIAAFALLGALAGCDPNKNSEGSGGPPPAPGSAAAPPGGADTAHLAAFEKPRKADGEINVKVITNGNSPFWDSMGEGLKVGLSETNSKGGWNAPAQTDNSSQKDTFEQAIAANVDGIAVSPIQSDAFAPVIDAAIDKGLPVITFDNDATGSKRLLYVGTNNYEAGVEAGKAALKLFPNGGKLVAFVGNMSAENARQRYEGFKEAVKGKNIEFLAEPYEDDKDAVGRAHSNVSDAITKYGDQITGFLGLYSYNGPAIVDEVQKAKLLGKVKILCFDGEPKTLENLRNKLVDVTVVQKPYEFGRLSAHLLTLINQKGLTGAMDAIQPELDKLGMKLDREKRIIDTGVTVVTPENAQEFLKDLEAKGLKST